MGKLRVIPDQIISLGGGGLRAFGPAMRWLLSDLFSTALAAGSVNGTAAEPGPGTRTVVDTESKLSIADGDLFFNGGKATPAFNDPLLHFGTTARALGKMICCQFSRETLAGENLIIGYGAAITGTPSDAVAYIAGGVLYARQSSNTWLTALANNTDYQMAIVLRATGAWYFVKGGAFTSWTLLIPGMNSNAATLYRQVNSNKSISRIRSFAMPDDVFVPTPLASDSFNRSNGSLGSTDGAGHQEANSGSGKAWADSIGTWAINSNTAKASALAGGAAIATIDAGAADVIIESLMATRSGGNLGVVARYVDANNYVVAYHDGTNIKLDKVVSGVVTNVATVVIAFTANRVLRLICDGTKFAMHYPNDASIGSTEYTISDAALQTGTRCGLYTTDAGNTFDTAVAWARKGDAYAALNRYFFSASPLTLMCIGDSKSNPAGSGAAWQQKLLSLANQSALWNYRAGHIAVNGGTMATITTAFDAALPGITATVDRVLINITVNDVSTLPDKATWQNQYRHIIDALIAKWPGALIYCARVWMQGQDANCDTLDAWIDEVVAGYSANPNVRLGFDERVWFKPNVATYSTDGTHYTNEAGASAAAAAWYAVI